MVVEADRRTPFRFVRNGMVVVGRFTDAQLLDCFDKTLMIHEVSGLALGDIYNAAVKEGKEDLIVQRLPDPASENYKDQVTIKTIKNRAWVALAIPPARRRMDRLTFTHHDAVAGLDAKTQDRLLAEAVKKNWTTAKMRKEANAEKGKGKAGGKGREPKKDEKFEDEEITMTLVMPRGFFPQVCDAVDGLIERGWVKRRTP